MTNTIPAAEITIEFRNRMTGTSGYVKTDDGRIRTWSSREDAEAYCAKHSTQMMSCWISEDE